MTQSDEKKTIREALDYARRFSDNFGIEYRCNEALAALSALDPEAIKREKDTEIAALKAEMDRLREAVSKIKADLKAPLELRGTMEQAVRSALLRAEEALSASPAEAEPARGGWIKCDYDRPETLPLFDEVVELAVVNNGQMARAFGGRSGYDEGWCWFQAESCLLYGGLPAELGDAMEWDDEKDIWWKPLAPLPQRRMEAAR